MATDRVNNFKLGVGDEIKADRDWCGVGLPQVAMHSQLPRCLTTNSTDITLESALKRDSSVKSDNSTNIVHSGAMKLVRKRSVCEVASSTLGVFTSRKTLNLFTYKASVTWPKLMLLCTAKISTLQCRAASILAK